MPNFLDVIKLRKDNSDGTTQRIDLNRHGIAWQSDKQYKFKNPSEEDMDGKTLKEYLEENTATPTDWIKPLWELDTKNETNNGLQNEDLIVWMRTAAFPNFRKLHRIINENLQAGDYTFEIDYSKSLLTIYHLEKAIE